LLAVPVAERHPGARLVREATPSSGEPRASLGIFHCMGASRGLLSRDLAKFFFA